MNVERRSRRAHRTIRRLERAIEKHALRPKRGTIQSVRDLTANFEKIKARAREERLEDLALAWQLSLRT